MYDSIKACNGVEFTFVVVDNNSKPEDLNKLDELASNNNVVVIKNNQNIGYFAGLNVGIRYVRKHYPDAKYLVVGNNDIILPSDFAQKLAECDAVLKKYPVVSPNIKMLDCTPQNPHVISGISKKREFIYDL
jgi:GT2 family glycosyltransferase